MSEYGRCLVERFGDRVAVVRLEGEHDMASAHELVEALEVVAGEGRDVVIDLTAAEFLDSAIIHALYAAPRGEADRRVALQVAPSSIVRRALEVAGVLNDFPHAATRDEAVALTEGGDAEA